MVLRRLRKTHRVSRFCATRWFFLEGEKKNHRVEIFSTRWFFSDFGPDKKKTSRPKFFNSMVFLGQRLSRKRSSWAESRDSMVFSNRTLVKARDRPVNALQRAHSLGVNSISVSRSFKIVQNLSCLNIIYSKNRTFRIPILSELFRQENVDLVEISQDMICTEIPEVCNTTTQNSKK